MRRPQRREPRSEVQWRASTVSCGAQRGQGGPNVCVQPRPKPSAEPGLGRVRPHAPRCGHAETLGVAAGVRRVARIGDGGMPTSYQAAASDASQESGGAGPGQRGHRGSSYRIWPGRALVAYRVPAGSATDWPGRCWRVEGPCGLTLSSAACVGWKPTVQVGCSEGLGRPMILLHLRPSGYQ